MKSGDFIQQKFQAWAARNGIPLQGSAGEKGKRNYVTKLEKNFFREELCAAARRAFTDGAGGELRGDIPSIQALHSSAAMAANLFCYWSENRQLSQLAQILGVPSTRIKAVGFERKYPVCATPDKYGLREPPHLDLGIDYERCTHRVGVECKLFEPYGRLEHKLLAKCYLDLPQVWDGIPACRELAEKLCRGLTGFKRLGPAQLLRHLLGLQFGAKKADVRLVYLYYDAPGDEGAEHRAEIKSFSNLIQRDKVRFVPMTVQEFILRAIRRCREDHREYLDYLAERYL